MFLGVQVCDCLAPSIVGYTRTVGLGGRVLLANGMACVCVCVKPCFGMIVLVMNMVANYHVADTNLR